MLGPAMQLPEPLWRRINVAWAVFYVGCAGLNWYIAANFDNDTWVSFKTWGMMLLNLVFMACHVPFVAKHLHDEPPPSPTSTPSSSTTGTTP
jgi:intracellular septation protein